MRIFLSYAHPERDLAERLTLGLENEGHDVFFDRDDLPPGQSFDDRIRAAIRRSHLLVFVASPSSLSKGSYAQTELAMAQRRWNHPAGRVLPVVVGNLTINDLPPYLRAVSVAKPEGDVIADVLDSVSRLARGRRRILLRRVVTGTTLLLAIAVLVWRWAVTNRQVLTVEELVIVQGQTPGNDAPEFRFDVTFRNRTDEAITVVDVSPRSVNDLASFGGTVTDWLNVNPDTTGSVSVTASVQQDAGVEQFRWRLCWGYVRTEDLYYELYPGNLSADMFMARYRREECDRRRDWPGSPSDR
jgi:hypothetical protein